MSPTLEVEPGIEEFIETGGEITDRYEDGRPKSWRCGKNAKGEPIDPPEVDPKEVVRSIGSDGWYRGDNPSADVLEEKKLWRSDWNDADATPHYGQAGYGKKQE